MDSVGLFSGIFSTWNPLKEKSNAFLSYAGIVLEGIVKGWNNVFLKVINYYGPYENIKAFGIKFWKMEFDMILWLF